MAVAFDAVASATGFTSTTTTLSWTHTAGAGGTTVLVALVWGATNGPPSVTAATYDGNPLTLLDTQATNNVTASGTISLYGLTGQGAGAKTVSFTFTSAPSGGGSPIAIGNSISFTGASAFGAPAKNYGSSAAVAVTLTGTAAGNMGFAAECHGTNGTISWTAGTQRFNDEVNASSGAGNLSGATLPGGGDLAFAETIPNDNWGVIAVEAQVAAGQESGPNYAGAAADLGGGSGSWADTGNATGSGTGTVATWTAP